ncbi:DUF559 domain-containing protein [Iodobacter sp. CM08]|uniref:endonuclease domain-containing protein n=1 Tax=Iodobacter sp. CM08 TaxID=3085902 RepID=UPI0029816B32|nr:DUF559 domain-containing protein [Iodobacter sp. CM08]MDW5415591.1 DUF559 domain-containing protein [Iodobacter sp. CM08]
MRDRARQLRVQATPFEQSLWQHLRAGRLAGFKFRRQQVIGRYIVDFACMQVKVIIELDGSQHASAASNDAERDACLKSQGYRVLRVWNNEWDQQPEAVLEQLWRLLHE